MRIALVHMRHAQVGGTERILNEVSRRLSERGHEVTLVCRSHAEATHPSQRFVVLRSPVIGSAWRMWAFAEAVEKHLARTTYDLVFGLGRTWTQDVLRASGGSHAAWIEQLSKAQGGSWRDALWLHALKNRLALRIERRAYAPGAYRRVITNSNLVRDDLAARYALPLDKTEVIYNGVDLARFRPRAESERAELRRGLGWSADEIVFLFLGKGFARKGLERGLRAFRELAAMEPRARLAIAGEDAGQPWYEALARELGVAERVQFLGLRRDPELCLAACDVHFLPTWYDSFAFTVLEALACGTPVVTTTSAGAAELVDSGIHGSVVSGAAEAAELAAALRVWCDPERRRASTGRARARAELHGFETTMQRMIAVLERVALERATTVDRRTRDS
ncbi:MAG: glycosyltransferase family 4 protein [Planctomycetes bacterium]|nr:glycosyltransferase family 4 protein [Planctomycetota bacterium]